MLVNVRLKDEIHSNSVPDEQSVIPPPEPRQGIQESTVTQSTPAATGPMESIGTVSDLGQIPVEEVEVKASSRIIVLSEPRSPGADRFRYLRMRLRELRANGQLKSLVVTSPLPRDGKSTVALNLATVLAEGGKWNVLLVEADLHRPSMARILGIPRRPGLADCLESGLDPMSAFRRLEPLGWHLVQAGEPKGNPTESLQSPVLTRVVATWSARFDWVIIDSPPVAPLTDALCLARIADASLLVLRAGNTPRDSVEEALSLLGPGRVAGIVLNGAKGLNRLYAKYSGYYGKK